MKIIYCIDSINNVGGIQRVTVAKANALAEMPGNEVWILSADHSGERVLDVSPKVRVVDLGVDYYKDDWKSRWNVLKGIVIKRSLHRRRLEEVLHEVNPDILVSVGQSEKNFLPRIQGKWATVREIHYVKDYRWKAAQSIFDKILAFGGDLLDYSFYIKKYDRIVVLTHEDKELNWKDNPKVAVIPNPVEVRSGHISALNEKRIIAVGRLVQQKNFASLVNAFSLVAMRHPDWRLDIFGDGPEKSRLQTLISSLGLDDKIRLRGNTNRVIEEMVGSSMLAMTSKFEGFGVVLIEAMSVGLPVVSYACPCGPKDIISDSKNGFLVPTDDEKTMADKICILIEDVGLRKQMGAEALRRSEDFSVANIMKKWTDLFENMLSRC